MRVLVTGGTGFIGSHVAAALTAGGHEVLVLDALLPCAHPGGVPPFRGGPGFEFVHARLAPRTCFAARARELASVLRPADACAGGTAGARHAVADTTIEGTRSDLLLWLTNRGPAPSIRVAGQPGVAAAWAQLRR